jgi:osmotically-inducible protein OsmY
MSDRYWDREREEDRGRRHRGEGYWGGSYDYPGERDRERAYGRRRDERSFLERLRDELRSWFNEEEYGRGRTRDERDTGRWGGSDEQVDRDWARQWGYLEGRGQRAGDRGTSRGWGYGGWGYGVGESPWRGEEYRGPGSGWGWTEQERHWRPSSSWSGYGAAEREGRDDPWRSGGGMFSRSFAGRGPRGYQRSDERIREDICERMCDSAELDASGIDIVVVSGEVTLQGSVNDRYDKRLAEDLTERVSGVREVNNQLRVSSGQEGSQQQQQNRPGDSPRYRVA